MITTGLTSFMLSITSSAGTTCPLCRRILAASIRVAGGRGMDLRHIKTSETSVKEKVFSVPGFRVELHLGSARMSSDNLPSIVKFLEIHRRIAHYLLLGIWESDRPPSEG
jgi:hypothetical protein